MTRKPPAKPKSSGKPPQTSSMRRRQAAELGAIPMYLPPDILAGLTPVTRVAPVGGAGVAPATPPPSQLQQSVQQQQRDVRPDENTFVRAVRDIAAAAWKLKSIVFKPGSDEPEPATVLDAKQLSDIGFYTERLYNALETLGVTVLDFTGQPFDGDMPVKVISAKPTPGVTEDIIDQTLLPTIKFNKTSEFYPGNVITLKPEETLAVAQPPPASASSDAPASPPSPSSSDAPAS